MTTKERYENYVEEHCSKCKNKTKYNCDIHINCNGIAKCECYEKE